MASGSWITGEAFDTQVNEYECDNKVVHWTALSRTDVYKVIWLIERMSCYGKNCWFSKIVNEAGEDFRVFLPAGMVYRLKRERKVGQSLFFKALGQTKKEHKTQNLFEMAFSNDPSSLDYLFLQEEPEADR